MDIRLTALPEPVQRVLDRRVGEGGEITAAVFLVCQLYGDAWALAEIIGDEIRSSRGRYAQALRIERYGAELACGCSPDRRDALIFLGVNSIYVNTLHNAEWFAQARFEDETKGGCLEPFLNHWRLDRSMKPTPRCARRLDSPRAIRRYVKGMEEIEHQRALFRIVLGISSSGGDTTQARAAVFADMDRQRSAIRTTHVAVQRREPALRKTVRAERRIVRRAAMIAAAIIGAQSVSAFARGEEVMLPGERFTIGVRLQGPISASGHGAVQVALHHGGRRLAKLCTYQEGTPALDQLASLALEVSAGEEDGILDNGNLFAVEDAGNMHPIIRERLVWRSARTWNDEQQAFNFSASEYRVRTSPIYREAALTAVLDRPSRLVRQVAAHVEAIR